jgi:predicted RNA methylase
MISLSELEDRRRHLQGELDGGKEQSERNRLGQFATPTELAVEILRFARGLFPAHTSVRFLDPAFGTGAFYSALLREFPKHEIESATGFEIDPIYGEPAMSLWRETGLKLHLTDFTRSVPPSKEEEKFNLLICNPPYVRHHHLGAEQKQRLQELALKTCGVRIGGLAGLYCYFVALCQAWMAQDAVAGWLIPSEFMDVNYGRPLKEYLLNEVTLLRVHRFDPHDVQFQDALVSSAVLWFRNRKPASPYSVEFSFGGTLTQPRLSRSVSTSTLRNEPKWTRFPLSGMREPSASLVLGDLFAIKRGVATGNNDFFVLSQREIEQHQLPIKVFQPVLPSPRYLRSDEIASDKNGWPLVSPQLFLLNCRLPEDEVEAKYPALFRYLREGKKHGIDQRYLSRHREPWYAQEHRPPSPFLCTYMGRGNANGRAFRFLLNHSKAAATNVYLMMYPRTVVKAELANDPALVRRLWEALNRLQPSAMLDEGRVYGGGLHKLEPKELGNIPADEISALLSFPLERTPQQALLFSELQVP